MAFIRNAFTDLYYSYNQDGKDSIYPGPCFPGTSNLYDSNNGNNRNYRIYFSGKTFDIGYHAIIVWPVVNTSDTDLYSDCSNIKTFIYKKIWKLGVEEVQVKLR